MADRETKERKLIALMVNDLGPGLGKKEMADLEGEVRALPNDRLDATLVERLDLHHPTSEEDLEQALLHVEERAGSNPGGFTDAPDMSHEPRPEERQV
jgi:hypothetical protein